MHMIAILRIINGWLVVSNMALIVHFLYGMSSFPLTNSYFSRWLLHHQPDGVGYTFMWKSTCLKAAESAQGHCSNSQIAQFVSVIYTLRESKMTGCKVYSRGLFFLIPANHVWLPEGVLWLDMSLKYEVLIPSCGNLPNSLRRSEDLWSG